MYPSLPNQTLQTCETEWKHIINNNNTSLHIFQEICWSNLACQCPHVKRRIFHYKLLSRILIFFSWLPFSVFCVLSELFDLFENSGMYIVHCTVLYVTESQELFPCFFYLMNHPIWISNLHADMSILKYDMRWLKYDMRCLKYDMRCLKYGMRCLKYDMRCLKYDMRCLKYDMRCLKLKYDMRCLFVS